MAYLATKHAYEFAVRSGGPNAGHTFHSHGHKFTTRHIPCAAACTTTRLLLSPAMLIDPDLLHQELDHLAPLAARERLEIDRLAGIITPRHIEATDDDRGSTRAGVGPAQADRVRRRLKVASDDPRLAPLARIDVISLVNRLVDSGKLGIVEGVQGSGLSLNNHWYPFATSRDVHAASMLSDAGLSPFLTRKIYLVFRTYPIRWPGKSGPMGAPELSWDQIWYRSGRSSGEPELSAFGGGVRRVSEFNWDEAERAIAVNRPSALCLSCVDYLDHRDYALRRFCELSKASRRFVDELENRFNVPVEIVSTGPEEDHVIDRT